MSFAFGIGIGTQNNQGEWLEVFYQQPVMTPDNTLMDVISNALDYKGGNQAIERDCRATQPTCQRPAPGWPDRPGSTG